MKTPRVHDFDPSAKAPELASPLDNLPTIIPPQKKQVAPPIQQQRENLPHSSERHDHVVRPVQSVPPVRPVLPASPIKRVMRQRHPFDIYQDQYEALRDLAAEERKQGGAGSMSAMAREALDKFIALKRKVGK
jgi:hypothetical protein